MEKPGVGKQKIRFIQIGDGPALRGLVNDWMNSVENGEIYEGVACILPQNSEQRALIEHEGRYSLYTTGIGKNGRPEKKQIRCLRNAFGPEAWDAALAAVADENTCCILTDASDEDPLSPVHDDRSRPRSLAGRVAMLMLERYAKHLGGIAVYCMEPVEHSAQRLQLSVVSLAMAWALPHGFVDWLVHANSFVSCYACRAVSVALEGEERQPVLQAEGYGRLFVESGTLPPFFLPMQAIGREISASKEAGRLFERRQNISTVLIWCMGLTAQALDMNALNAPLSDESLRAWIARLMLHEYLPALNEDGALALLAEAMERLDNVYFHIPVASASIDFVSVFMRLLLPALQTNRMASSRCRRTVLMMALMVMESIRTQDKRFHALSSDMEPEALVYAVLSDQTLWGSDLRRAEGLEQALTDAVRDLQLLGLAQSLAQADGQT